jgi:dolichol kinase
MVIVLLLNRQLKIMHYLGNIRQKTYGEVFLALAITTTALITDNKIFFAIAMLQVALADGFAAIIGTKFGKMWQYKVFYQTKSILGSMTFWIVSLCVLGAGLLAAHDVIPISHFGTDNLAIPVTVIIALNMAQVTN